MRRPSSYTQTTAVIALAACAITVVVVFCFFYYHFDPSRAPRCFFKVLTGYDCPGCGSQRAFHSLLHGDVAAAWGYNPFVFFAVPAALWYFTVEALRKRYPRLHARTCHPLITTAVLIGVVAWWILRNV